MLGKLLKSLLVAAAIITSTAAPLSAEEMPSSLATVTLGVGRTAPVSQYATVRKGSRGADVKTLQNILNYLIGANLVVDGIAGNATVNAIKTYQRMDGLTADGICGSGTWSHLTQDYNDACNGLVRNGSVGPQVREFQTKYNAVTGANLTVDGIAGNATVNAIKTYQRMKGLTVDGIAGPKTFAALRADYNNASQAPAPSSSLGNYVNSLVGRNAIDWGGLDSSTQCVELPKYYIQQYFGVNCRNRGLGNGNTLYSGIANAYPNLFTSIKYYDGFVPQVGDIISFHSATSPTKGHAAIVIAVSDKVYTIA